MAFQLNHYMCEICQRSKGHLDHFSLQPLPMPCGPWEDISYNFIIKLPLSHGMDSILVVVDHFSKILYLIPCKEALNAEGVTQLYLQHIWCLQGTLKQTVSEGGPTCNSKFLRVLFESHQIKPLFSGAYHPETDGRQSQESMGGGRSA